MSYHLWVPNQFICFFNIMVVIKRLATTKSVHLFVRTRLSNDVNVIFVNFSNYFISCKYTSSKMTKCICSVNISWSWFIFGTSIGPTFAMNLNPYLLWLRLDTYACSVWVHPHIRALATLIPLVHGANMGPIRGRQDPGGCHVSPMNLAIWGR